MSDYGWLKTAFPGCLMAKAKSKKKKNKPRKRERTSDVTVNEDDVNQTGAAATKGSSDAVNRSALVEADDDLTAGEKLLKQAEPYFAHILLGALSLILAWVLINYFINIRNENASAQWRELSNARTNSLISGSPSALREMADLYPNEKASNWALLMASDFEFNRGIDMLSNDRIGGLKLIEKAAESAQKVVDSPASAKSPLAQQRSLFLAARANEALGKFEASGKFYSELVESAPDSALASAAKRGLERSTNKDYAAVYEQFRTYEEATEEAPGPLVPDAPDLKFDVDIPEGEPAMVEPKKDEPIDETKSFKPGEAKMPKSEPTETKAEDKAVEMKDQDKASEMKAEEKPAAETPAAETEKPPAPAEEPAKPVAETPADPAPETPELPAEEAPSETVPSEGEPPATEPAESSDG